MPRIFICCMYVALLAGVCSPADAHTVNYHVENRGISIRVFYDPEDPASYSSYEILGPGDTIPHQKGRTDKNGFVSFMPDRQGKWVVKVLGESEHGMHGTTIEVQVDKDLTMGSFKKPLVAKFTKAFVGGSILLALFGAWSLLATRKRNEKRTPPTSSGERGNKPVED
jgi:nickel transport protein